MPAILLAVMQLLHWGYWNILTGEVSWDLSRQWDVFLSRICDDCYMIYRDTDIYHMCRSDCYNNRFFLGCMDVMMVSKRTRSKAARFVNMINDDMYTSRRRWGEAIGVLPCSDNYFEIPVPIFIKIFQLSMCGHFMKYLRQSIGIKCHINHQSSQLLE